MIADDFFEQMIEMTELRQQMHRRPVLEANVLGLLGAKVSIIYCNLI